MKTNKLIVRALILLGFGAVAGLAGSCGASRASKSRTPENTPAADSIMISGGDTPVQVMYGVPPARFDENKPIRERVQ